MSWSTFELRVRLAPWNRFQPSSKIFLLTVTRRYFFYGSLMLFLSCVCYAFVRVCLLVPCGHLLGKDWLRSSCLWCLIVSLLLSHWYPGSGVVLDCIDSWSLPSFLLSRRSIDNVHLKISYKFQIFGIYHICAVIPEHLLLAYIKYGCTGANPEKIVRGVKNVFGFSHHILQREEGVRTNILSGQWLARQWNAILMAFHWWSDDGVIS